MVTGTHGSAALALSIAVAFTCAQLVPRPAWAGLVPTEELLAAGDAGAARGRVEAFLDRPAVRAQLRALGVAPEEAETRVAALSDAEVARLDARLAQLPAGEGFLEVVAGTILLVFLVLLVTDLLGLTDVFPFIDPLPRGGDSS